MQHAAWDAAAELRHAFRRTDDRITELEEMEVGPTFYDGLLSLMREPIDAGGAVRVRLLWERLIRQAESYKMVATNDAVEGAEHLPGLHQVERMQIIANDIACGTQIHKVTALNEVALTCDVASRLPQCWMALNRGGLSLRHVQALADMLENCPDWVASAVDAQAVPLAMQRGWTPGQLASEGHKIVITIDPEGAAERAAAAKERNSDVRFRAEPDEMATIRATGDAVGARDAYNVLDERAEELRRAGDCRRIGELRFAAFKEAVLGESPEILTEEGEVLPAPESTPDEPPTEMGGDEPAAAGTGNDEPADERAADEPPAAEESGDEPAADEPGAAESSAPRPPAAKRANRPARRAARRHAPQRRDALVRIDFSTYLGADDGPGWLDGYGPISAVTARALAGDAAMRRLLTDPPTGKTIDLGRLRYRPSQQLRDAVVARDVTCRAYGCTRPARKCQIDHRHERRDGGPTNCENLDALCAFHHSLKSKGLMKVHHNADGSYTIRTVLGFTFTRPPDPYPIEKVVPPDEGHLSPDAPAEVLDSDPDPPGPDDPLPEMPPLSPEDFLEYCDQFARDLYEDASANWAELMNAHTYSPAD